MGKTPAELMMERETRTCLGHVPKRLLEISLPDLSWRIGAGEFLLRAIGDHYFHYRRGEGVTIHRGAGADISEESLWLNGSVYAAIASINGLLPIHASAVAFNDRVYAFTGPAGAGKSTLIAGLGNHDFPMFCDDTLLLDVSEPGRILCLPGHKRLKLTEEALELTGASREEKVSLSVDKFYSVSAAGDVGIAMPLAELIFLEEGPELGFIQLSGIERFTRMQDEHYTTQLYAGAQGFDRAGYFNHIVRLANAIALSRFVRPLDPRHFEEGVRLIAAHITDSGSIDA